MAWSIFLILLTGACIAWYEVPKLVSRQMWRELTAFGGLLALGLGLAIAQAAHLPVPNPTSVLEKVFGPISQLIYQ
jgi:uncharacterized membrane protein YqgA involved in biofilm formation